MKNNRPCFLFFRCLLFASILLCFNKKLPAQILGGLPDPEFNPADTGLIQKLLLHNFNSHNMTLFEGKGRNLVGLSVDPELQFDPQRHNHTFFIDDSLRRAPELIFPFENMATIFKVNGVPFGLRYFLTVTGSNPDSIFLRLRLARLSQQNFPESLEFSTLNFFPRPWLARLAGSDSSLFLNLSICPEGSQQRSRITIFRFRQNLEQVDSRSFSGFELQSQLFKNGRLLCIGNQLTGSGSSRMAIKVFNEALQEQINLYPDLPPNLELGSLDVAETDALGRLILGGRYRLNGIWQTGFLRFLTNGALDAGFGPAQLPLVQGSAKLAIAQNGRLLAAWFNDNEEDARIWVRQYSADGQLLEARLSANHTGKGKLIVELFHHEKEQFLVRTENLNQKLRASEYVESYSPNSWPYGIDSLPQYRYRFWIGKQAEGYRIGNDMGVVRNVLMNQNVIPVHGFTGNPFLKKIAITGPIESYQGIFRPRLFIMDPKGQMDTLFRGLQYFPRAWREEYISKSYYRQLPVKGNKVLIFRNTRRYGPFSDTVRRWNYDGSEDLSFAKYRAVAPFIPVLKDSLFLACRVTNMGRPRNPDWDTTNGSTIEIVKINQLGDQVGVLASFQLSVDTIHSQWGRQYLPEVLDNRGNLWMQTRIPKVIGGVLFFSRIKPNGEVKHLRNDSLLGSHKLISVEVNHQGHITLTGRFSTLWDTSGGQPAEYNRLTFDSNFVLLHKVRFRKLDQFSAELSPFAYLNPLSKLPDGKLLYLYGWSNPWSQNQERPQYLLRYHSDGRWDPTFIPARLAQNSWYEFLEVFGDRIYSGFTYNYKGNDEPIFGPSKKVGLHCLMLNSVPGDKSFVQGQVQRVAAPASGCNPAGERSPVFNKVIKEQNTGQIAFTDQNGFYSMPLSPGSYQLGQAGGNGIFDPQICPLPATPLLPAEVEQAGMVYPNHNFINQALACPKLSMELVQPRFRLCSRSRFTIRYRNTGTAPEPNARLRVSLPPAVKIESASHAFSYSPDSSVIFQLGNLAPGQHGAILVQDTVACISTPDSNSRACYSVRLEPMLPCNVVPPSAFNWDGAWIDGYSYFHPPSQKVRMVLVNKGNTMTDSVGVNFGRWNFSDFRQLKIKLNAGDSVVFQFPGNEEETYILRVWQPKNCPVGRAGTVLHGGTSTIRNYLAFQDGWLMDQSATACPGFRFSYDPNEKHVEPAYPVPPGEELNYTIHFENYGNDTAYAVVVVDSLPAGTDPTTFQFRGSSHPVQISLDGHTEQAVATFAFMPIRLTAKRQDSVLSKGQLSFSVRLKENVLPASEHSNKAYIFFDRNDPIITNTVVTRVWPESILTSSSQTLREGPDEHMIVYPNPSRSEFQVLIPTAWAKEEISVLDARGSLVRTIKPKANYCRVEGLKPGFYTLHVQGGKPVKVLVTE